METFNMKLIILRGLPGSGKSTLANSIKSDSARQIEIVEADQFFINEDGQYNFDPSKLYQAHKSCYDRAENFMKAGIDLIVSNTFTTEKEIDPYLKLGEKYDYSIFSLIVENRHGNESIHDVPDKTVQKMRNRFSVKI